MRENIVRFSLDIRTDEESYFVCVLINDRVMEIPLWSFYEFILQHDKRILELSEAHDEWETLTTDLVDYKYPFLEQLNVYLNQFDEKQIMEFTRPINA